MLIRVVNDTLSSEALRVMEVDHIISESPGFAYNMEMWERQKKFPQDNLPVMEMP